MIGLQKLKLMYKLFLIATLIIGNPSEINSQIAGKLKKENEIILDNLHLQNDNKNPISIKWNSLKQPGPKKIFIKSLYISAPLIALGVYNNKNDDAFINKYEFWEDRNEHNPNFHTRYDDYLQFAPIAVVYGLNVLGIKGEHNAWNQTKLILKSELLMTAIVFPLKKLSHVLRPDESGYDAFPSGHTAQAFLSAELLRKEYGKKYPWLAVGGFLAATSVGALRILNNKHWITDVLTGAGIGIFSVNLVYLTHKNHWPLGNKKVQFVPTYSNTGIAVYINWHLGN
jgi:hypothetical protein